MSAKFRKPKFLKGLSKSKPTSTHVKKADLENLGDVLDYDTIYKRISMNEDNYDIQRSAMLGANGYFTAKQATELLTIVKSSDSRLNFLKVIQKKLYAMTCQDAVPVLLLMNPRHVKLEAIQLVIRVLIDPENYEDLHPSVPYEEDRKELAKMAIQAIKKNKPTSAPTQRSAWASGRVSDDEDIQLSKKCLPAATMKIAYMGSCAVKDDTEVVDLEDDDTAPKPCRPPTYNRSAPVENHFHQPFSPRNNIHYDQTSPMQLPGMML